MAGDAVLISETFCSLQGEGSLVGVPSWFCRLSGCNLRCRWCDTPYASWSPEGETRTVESLLAEAAASGLSHAVLTGGEPMVFPQLAALSSGLRAQGVHVTIETAGTVDRDDVAFDLLSLSPKLSNSTPRGDARDPLGLWAERHEARRINTAALQALLDRSDSGMFSGAGGGGRARQFKFVVTGERDLAEIDALLATLRGWRPGEVFLMPEGTERPDRALVEWTIRTCLARNWRYAHRLHIELFGHTRGT